MATKLTDKQQLFCEEYLVDLNAYRAAVAAGYSEKTAAVIGYENLNKPYIAEYIRSSLEKRLSGLEISQERVLNEIARVAFGDVRSLFNEDGSLKLISELDDDAARSIAGFDVVVKSLGDGEVEHVAKVKSADKMRGLEMLGKYLALFTEKHEHSGPNGGPIQSEIKPSETLKHLLDGIAGRKG